jgi:pimeloyl-ACP methyl ester carboxylesterase
MAAVRLRECNAWAAAGYPADTGAREAIASGPDGGPTQPRSSCMSTFHALSKLHLQRESVICLHSSGASGRQWDAIASPLSTQFDVVTPDLLGYGARTTWPTGTPASLTDEAQALAPLLDARPGGVHLLGHSYGGAVALQMALRWPSRIKSLTLYEPVRFALLFGDPETAEVGDEIVRAGRRIGMMVLSGRNHAAAALFVDYWSGDGAWDSMPQGRRDALAARMPKVHAEFESLFADRVPLAAYARLEMPVRLLRGDRSPLPPRMVVGRLGWQLPNVDVVTLAGLGHMGPLTHAQEVARALPQWLQPKMHELAA